MDCVPKKTSNFEKAKRSNLTHLVHHCLVAVPPPPPRFSLVEWHLDNRQKSRTCLDQQQLADKIIVECDRTNDQVNEITLMNKREVDHNLQDKIDEIQFMKDEIDNQRKSVVREKDSLTLFADRINDCLTVIKECKNICQKCAILREGRLGIDLCHDDVEEQLWKERDLLEGTEILLKKNLEQAQEQLRRLRSTVYFMDRDLEDKANVLKIDGVNLGLNEKSLQLSIYHGFTPLDPANITMEEWQQFSKDNIERGAKEINCSRMMVVYIDLIINQGMQDLKCQYDVVNEAFRKRIEQTKEAKYKMEIQHSETVRQVNEITRAISRMEISLAGKEGFLALAHTRLGNRAQRPGIELCRDTVETNLVNEVLELRQNINKIQQSIAEAQASMRYLLKTQVQLEEDINIKTNSLKIDEVDCMTIRLGMNYHQY